MIIEFIRENGSISNKEAREMLGLAESTTKRIFREMVEKNLLAMEGEKRNRRYVLPKK